MQAAQLAWAETSPEAEQALRDARVRAALRVAAQLNVPIDRLHSLRLAMGDQWSVADERSGGLKDKLSDWYEEDGETAGMWEFEAVNAAVDEMWPDVVMETDQWVRRVLGGTA